MDYDFTYMSGQSVAPVFPALLAIAESTGATPLDVIGAFIIGCEVSARIGRSVPELGNNGGWHITGIVGGIFAAAACAKLLKLPVEQVAQAPSASTPNIPATSRQRNSPLPMCSPIRLSTAYLKSTPSRLRRSRMRA